jgi:hypothetical protein
VTTPFVHEMRVAPGASPGLDQRRADIRPGGREKKKGLALRGRRPPSVSLERLDPQLPSADPALDGIEIV